MNYKKIYNSFIEDRLLKQSEIIGYSEKHHIVPKSLGGSDDEYNIINLCPSDHYFAHSLLAKIHGGPMYFALMLMSQDRSSSARGYRPSRLKYDQVKKKMAAEKKRMMTGKGNHFYGKRHSSESIAKISANRTGKCIGVYHPSFGKPSKLIGRKLSEETKKKIDMMVGSRNNKAKLNEEIAMDIFNSKELTQTLALQYEVSISTIKRIRSKKQWRHVHVNT